MFSLNDDVVTVMLSVEERSILAQVPRLLDDVSDPADPGYEVLHRPMYPDDVVRAEELAGLIEDESRIERGRDRKVVTAIASGETLMSVEDARRFLRSVNEARIVLAARAGAFDSVESWEKDISSDPALAAVAWLGYMQSELIQVFVSRDT